MRLIDADWAERKANEIIDGYAWAIRMAVGNAPTVDAVPVVHGRWEPSDYNGFCLCSVCRDCYIDKTWTIGGKWRYCPTCGAKMDLEETP